MFELFRVYTLNNYVITTKSLRAPLEGAFGVLMVLPPSNTQVVYYCVDGALIAHAVRAVSLPCNTCL